VRLIYIKQDWHNNPKRRKPKRSLLLPKKHIDRFQKLATGEVIDWKNIPQQTRQMHQKYIAELNKRSHIRSLKQSCWLKLWT